MIYINNKEKIDNIKLNKNNFYVVTDFDKTLTEGSSNSTWAVVANANTLGDEYTKSRNELYNFYRPIEINPSISDDEKNKYMEEWWKKHINLFFKYNLKENDIENSMKNGGLKYREGAKKFLKNMHNFQIPVIIISSGIGNVIEIFLKNENDYYENINILSNFIQYENGAIKGLKGKTMHALNKNIAELNKSNREKIKNRKYKLLLGDGIADLKMVAEEELINTITVGFLDEKIDENLEFYNKCFDIVLTNNGSFEELNDVLKIY